MAASSGSSGSTGSSIGSDSDDSDECCPRGVAVRPKLSAAAEQHEQTRARNAVVVAGLLATKMRSNDHQGTFAFERDAAAESPEAVAQRKAVQQENEARQREGRAMLRAEREARAVAKWPLERERARTKLLEALVAEVGRQARQAREHFDAARCLARGSVPQKDTGVPTSAFRQMGLTGMHCSPEQARFATTLSRVTYADERILYNGMDDFNNYGEDDMVDKTPLAAAAHAVALKLMRARKESERLRFKVKCFLERFGTDEEILEVECRLSKSWVGDWSDIWMLSDYLKAKRQRSEDLAWAAGVLEDWYGPDYD